MCREDQCCTSKLISEWVSYTLSSAEDVIDGKAAPRSWDQPHAGKFLIGYRRDERWSVSLTGSIHEGWPTTPVLAEVDDEGELEAVPGERNTDRFSRYARFDLKARKAFSVPRGRLWLTMEVVNVTNRDNDCCLNDVFFETGPGGTVVVRRDFDQWLGLTPSFNIQWEY